MMSLQEIKSSGTTAFLSPDVISTHPIYTSDRQDIRHQTGNSFCVLDSVGSLSYWICKKSLIQMFIFMHLYTKI